MKEHREIVTALTWFHPSSYSSTMVSSASDAAADAVSVEEKHLTPGDPMRNAFFTCSLDKTIKLWMRFKVVATYTDHQGNYCPSLFKFLYHVI
jgi:hypothetical protein